jgi:hypothetical protein
VIHVGVHVAALALDTPPLAVEEVALPHPSAIALILAASTVTILAVVAHPSRCRPLA